MSTVGRGDGEQRSLTGSDYPADSVAVVAGGGRPRVEVKIAAVANQAAAWVGTAVAVAGTHGHVSVFDRHGRALALVLRGYVRVPSFDAALPGADPHEGGWKRGATKPGGSGSEGIWSTLPTNDRRACVRVTVWFSTGRS